MASLPLMLSRLPTPFPSCSRRLHCRRSHDDLASSPLMLSRLPTPSPSFSRPSSLSLHLRSIPAPASFSGRSHGDLSGDIIVVDGGKNLIFEPLSPVTAEAALQSRSGVRVVVVLGIPIIPIPKDEEAVEYMAWLISESLRQYAMSFTHMLEKAGASAELIGGQSFMTTTACLEAEESLKQYPELSKMDPTIIGKVLETGQIAVVTSVATDLDAVNKTYPLDSRQVAANLAMQLKAKKLVFLTDGWLYNGWEPEIGFRELDSRISGGDVGGDQGCLLRYVGEALRGGVKRVKLVACGAEQPLSDGGSGTTIFFD